MDFLSLTLPVLDRLAAGPHRAAELSELPNLFRPAGLHFLCPLLNHAADRVVWRREAGPHRPLVPHPIDRIPHHPSRRFHAQTDPEADVDQVLIELPVPALGFHSNPLTLYTRSLR